MCSLCLLLLGVRIDLIAYFITPDEIVVENLPLLKSDSQLITPELKIQNRQDLSLRLNSTLSIRIRLDSKNFAVLDSPKKLHGYFSSFAQKDLLQNKSDLKKVYGVNDSLYIKLSPFIRIESSAT